MSYLDAWSAIRPVTAYISTGENTAWPMKGSGGWVTDRVSQQHGFCWIAICRWCIAAVVVENDQRPTPLVTRWSEVTFVHRDSRDPDCEERFIRDPGDPNHWSYR